MSNETEQKMLDCAKNATQGEWKFVDQYWVYANDLCILKTEYTDGPPADRTPNAAHIAASSPQNVIALIESKRALEAFVQELDEEWFFESKGKWGHSQCRLCGASNSHYKEAEHMPDCPVGTLKALKGNQ